MRQHWRGIAYTAAAVLYFGAVAVAILSRPPASPSGPVAFNDPAGHSPVLCQDARALEALFVQGHEGNRGQTCSIEQEERVHAGRLLRGPLY